MTSITWNGAIWLRADGPLRAPKRSAPAVGLGTAPNCTHRYDSAMGTDLLTRTAELINIASESHHEQEIVKHFEAQLRAIPWLTVDRVGDNLVARTDLNREHRLLIGGHSDTVPANANETAVIDGDVVRGLGASDMKGGLAVLTTLAETVETPAVDVTYLIYACEEVAARFNGLNELFAQRPELVQADVALLGEPTSAMLEAGCQGTMRFAITLKGERAHTARAWMGRNAIHRLGGLLEAMEAYEPRQPMIDGCRYHEGLQAVFVEGGVAGNVVPDAVTITINHRYAPDRTAAEAEAHVREVVAPWMEEGDEMVQTDLSEAAAPGLDHPLFASMIARNDLEVKAKLGWTDVAFFASRGIPAANFGPADAHLAHTQGEWVSRDSLDRAYAVLHDLLTNGVD